MNVLFKLKYKLKDLTGLSPNSIWENLFKHEFTQHCIDATKQPPFIGVDLANMEIGCLHEHLINTIDVVHKKHFVGEDNKEDWLDAPKSSGYNHTSLPYHYSLLYGVESRSDLMLSGIFRYTDFPREFTLVSAFFTDKPNYSDGLKPITGNKYSGYVIRMTATPSEYPENFTPPKDRNLYDILFEVCGQMPDLTIQDELFSYHEPWLPNLNMNGAHRLLTFLGIPLAAVDFETTPNIESLGYNLSTEARKDINYPEVVFTSFKSEPTDFGSIEVANYAMTFANTHMLNAGVLSHKWPSNMTHAGELNDWLLKHKYILLAMLTKDMFKENPKVINSNQHYYDHSHEFESDYLNSLSTNTLEILYHMSLSYEGRHLKDLMMKQALSAQRAMIKSKRDFLAYFI